MPDIFTPYTLKDVTLRNRIVMSPMTMYRSVDGKMDDFHVMYLGARAAGGFGLVFPEQIAISPDGRTTTACAGLYNDEQMEGHQRVVDIIKKMGSTAGIQISHTGRKGSLVTPWAGGHMIPPEDPHGWQTVGPSAIAYGDDMPYVPRELTIPEIKEIIANFAATAKRATEVGYEWIELHFAHGYLGSAFYSPLANQRTDEYGGSFQNRLRFHLETLDAVRAAIPDGIPLTMRLGMDDLHPDGAQTEESIEAVRQMKDHGLDFADLSLGVNTNQMSENPFNQRGYMVERANRVREEVGIPVATSWNLGGPEYADELIKAEKIDLVFLGRPALSNPHWPVWAARELGYGDPFGLVPEDWAWWLRNVRGDPSSVGWPLIEEVDDLTPSQFVQVTEFADDSESDDDEAELKIA